MPRRELSISEKMAVLELMKKQPSISQRRLSAITGIPKSTIARIALQKQKILHESTIYGQQQQQGLLLCEERRRLLLSQAKREEEDERKRESKDDKDVEEEEEEEEGLNQWYSITEPVTRDPPDKSEVTTKPKRASGTHPATFSYSQHLFLTEPIDMELQMEQEKLEDTFLEEKRQMALIESILMDTEPSQVHSDMQKKQDLVVVAPPPTPVQPAPSQSNPKQKAVDQSLQLPTSVQPAPSQSTPKQMAADKASPGNVAVSKSPPIQSASHQATVKAGQPFPYYQLAPKLTISSQMASAKLAPEQAALGKMAVAQSTQVASQIKILKPLQKSTLVPVHTQPALRQITVAQPTTAKTSQSQKKRLLVVSNHQQSVMSSLASLWKSGKFCDAALGNGSTTVKVHKVVLSAVCPKLLSMFSEEFFSQKFLQVNFPQEVTKDALMAFGEYIYRGVLYLDNNILGQMKIIAKRLDNKELGKLCDRHLQYNKTEPTASLTNFPSTPMTIPAKTTSITSFASTVSLSSASSINAPVVNTKQEISKERTDLVPGQKVKVITLAPNWSGIATGGVVSPSIKARLAGSEDDEYGVLNITGHNQCFVSNTSFTLSSSNTEVASSSIESASSLMEECTIPFSEDADVESTKSKDPDSYKTPDLNPVSSVAEKVCSKSSPVNIDSSKPLSKSSDLTSLVDNSLTGDKVYPLELSTTGGDVLPLQTLQTVHVKPKLYEMDLT